MKKIIIIALALGFLVNVAYSAYDSHMNPERYYQAVRDGIVFNWE